MKCVVSFIVSLCLCLSAECTALAGDRPANVLSIYVEDLGYYTSERGEREPNSMIAGLQTPHLDALAKESAIFTRAFCGQSVCSPSKSAIYSGMLPHANGNWRNVYNRSGKQEASEGWIPLPALLTRANDPLNTGVGGMHEDLPTLIEKLKAEDVYCALSGKLHVQPARRCPYDAFVDPADLESVIKAAGEKPWLFWCNPSDTHAPFWKSIQTKLVNPKDRNSAPNDVDPAQIKMLPWLPDTPAARIDLHDDTVRQKDQQPLAYELLGQLCMNDAPPEELYDLNADPWGVHNLISDQAHAEALARMRAEFAQWRTATADADVHPSQIPRRTER